MEFFIKESRKRGRLFSYLICADEIQMEGSKATNKPH
jgi:hypothetical protein